MNSPMSSVSEKEFSRKMMTSFIQIAAVVILVFYCLQIVGPFISLVIWGLVLAVAIYPLHLKLTSLVGGNEKAAVTLMILIGLAIVVLPAWLMADSSITSIMGFAAEAKDGTLSIPPPNESVAEWPIIGKRVYETWSAAAANLGEALHSLNPSPREISEWLVRKVGSLAAGVLQIAVSVIIAGVATLYAKSGHNLSCAILSRITPERGEGLTNLSIATIRSVTNGVLGVAVIQAVFAGIGLFVMGVPHAGIIAAVVLITAIIQIPALLILGPVAFWVFSFADPIPATIFAIYMLLVALSDNVLKPILLGRGVDLPAVIVLLGAIGGMIQYGVIGLFLGAVILGLGYTIIAEWIRAADGDAAAETAD